MALGWTNRGKYLHQRWIYGAVALPAHFYVVLVTSANVPGPDTNTLSELTEITEGNGYTTGGYQLTPGATDFTITEDDSGDLAYTVIKDVTWTASGGSIPPSGSAAHYAVFTTDESTVGNRQVVHYWNLGGNVSKDNGFAITLAALTMRSKDS